MLRHKGFFKKILIYQIKNFKKEKEKKEKSQDKPLTKADDISSKICGIRKIPEPKETFCMMRLYLPNKKTVTPLTE